MKMAPPYSEKEVRELEEGFSRLCGREIVFQAVEDKSLIGGFVAFVDGNVYDTSYKTKLESFRALLKEQD